MKRRLNITGLCLLATFFVIFGSILSITFFSGGVDPAPVSVGEAATTSDN